MEPKINKESLEKLYLEAIDHKIVSKFDLHYKSPIVVEMERKIKEINLKVDNDIYTAVLDCKITVDKDELMKALRYDRDQYVRGYWAGYTDGAMAPKKMIPELRKMINDINTYLDKLEKKYGGKSNARIPNIHSALRGEDRHFCVRAACAGFEMWIDSHCPATHLYTRQLYEEYMAGRR